MCGCSRERTIVAEEPFGFDPEDVERFMQGLTARLRGAFGQMSANSGERPPWAAFFEQGGRSARPAPEPPTTGETGDGVWVIYTAGETGNAQIEQVFPNELDALRANKHNTDGGRKVRFLPYGIAVSVLDLPEDQAEN